MEGFISCRQWVPMQCCQTQSNSTPCKHWRGDHHHHLHVGPIINFGQQNAQNFPKRPEKNPIFQLSRLVTVWSKPQLWKYHFERKLLYKTFHPSNGNLFIHSQKLKSIVAQILNAHSPKCYAYFTIVFLLSFWFIYSSHNELNQARELWLYSAV